MLAQIVADVNEQQNRNFAKFEKKVYKKIEKKNALADNVCTWIIKRNMEDFALQRMEELTGLSRENVSHSFLVDEYNFKQETRKT
jgi:hypothetical protein